MELTSHFVSELNLIEALAADGATVGPLHPRLQTLIVQVMTTGKKVGYQLTLKIIRRGRWCVEVGSQATVVVIL